MRGAKRRHRSQNQAERRAKPARRSSRCIYPKTAAQKLHQSRSVLKNQNPQNGQHWTRFDWGSGAVCFGASPVAAVFGSAPGSATPPEHRIHCKPAPPAPPFKQDISTLLGVGHFYFALTWSRCLYFFHARFNFPPRNSARRSASSAAARRTQGCGWMKGSMVISTRLPLSSWRHVPCMRPLTARTGEGPTSRFYLCVRRMRGDCGRKLYCPCAAHLLEGGPLHFAANAAGGDR